MLADAPELPAIETIEDLLRLGKRLEQRFAEILEISSRLRDDSQFGQISNEFRKQLSSDTLVPVHRALAELTITLRSLEGSLGTEARILTSLKSANVKNREELKSVVGHLDEKIKAGQEIEAGEIAEAEHLQSVLLTMLPLEHVLVSRVQVCDSLSTIVKTTLLNLYAFGVELSASSVPDDRVRLTEILRPLSMSLGPRGQE